MLELTIKNIGNKNIYIYFIQFYYFSAKSDYQIIFDEKTDIEEVIDDHTIIKQKYLIILLDY